MKILEITATGLPLFKKELVISFYAQQRVAEDDKKKLFKLAGRNYFYLNTVNAMIGINASGKTSVLKVIHLALDIINNNPINHSEVKSILGNAEQVVFNIVFLDKEQNVCLLETEITSEKSKSGDIVYSISAEKLWTKASDSVKTKKQIVDFDGIEPYSIRDTKEVFLSEDVSFIIAHNKKTQDMVEFKSLLSYTNTNVLPFFDYIPVEIIEFLDPTIERLRFEKKNNQVYIHLKFKEKKEILLNNASDLEQYLSSGTIKGIIAFSVVKSVLQSGGYLLMDEIENHFNKEIVTTLVRFFMDSKLNRNGGVLIFTTHYPELLDIFDRNDSINIVRNRDGITVDNLSTILTRNDLKKSDVYQSGYLDGTTPMYDAYIRLKKNLIAELA